MQTFLLVALIWPIGIMSSMIKNVVIVGGGIHGSSTAYFLSQRPGVQVTVVERTAIAAAASGKAGGFLAREWGSGPTVQLHQKSFDMHAELASELNIKSYRVLETLSVSGRRKGPVDASWLDGKVTSSKMDGATAQVTPFEFTSRVFEEAQKLGKSRTDTFSFTNKSLFLTLNSPLFLFRCPSSHRSGQWDRA
jgi:glycine/D-amino acid oxidase-like deaminating enzyme